MMGRVRAIRKLLFRRAYGCDGYSAELGTAIRELAFPSGFDRPLELRPRDATQIVLCSVRIHRREVWI